MYEAINLNCEDFPFVLLALFLSQEDRHFSTTVTYEARLQNFRGLAFQETRSGASYLFSALHAPMGEWWKVVQVQKNHKSHFRAANNSIRSDKVNPRQLILQVSIIFMATFNNNYLGIFSRYK